MMSKIVDDLCFVAAAVSAFVYVKNENNSMDELFNANVEALTRSEESGTGTCYNSITTSEGQKVLYCGTCTYLPGKPDTFSGTGEC